MNKNVACERCITPRTTNIKSKRKFLSTQNNNRVSKDRFISYKNKKSKKSLNKQFKKSSTHQILPIPKKTILNKQPISSNSQYEITYRNLDDLLQFVQEKDFENPMNVKMKVCDYVFKNRIIKDQDFDKIHEGMVSKFQKHQNLIKVILVEIVSALDN